MTTTTETPTYDRVILGDGHVCKVARIHKWDGDVPVIVQLSDGRRVHDVHVAYYLRPGDVVTPEILREALG